MKVKLIVFFLLLTTIETSACTPTALKSEPTALPTSATVLEPKPTALPSTTVTKRPTETDFISSPTVSATLSPDTGEEETSTWVTPIPLGEWNAPETAATPLPEPGEVWGRHKVILRIHNVDKLTRRSDQLTRWSLWGSPAFTIAPDGSYWFFDVTQRSSRLIHLSATGDILHQFPARQAGYPIDIVATTERVWVLGDAERQIKTILSYDLVGNQHWILPLPETYQMILVPPPERIVDWYLTGLNINEDGVLFLEKSNGTGYVAMRWNEGEVEFGPLAAYEAYGHHYRFKTPEIKAPEMTVERWTLLIDEREIVLQGAEEELWIPGIIGAAPDGSVYLHVGIGYTAHVRHYSQDGKLIGMARVPEGFRSLLFGSDPYFSEMAVGPDGNLYELISTQDQDVMIVKVRWQAELARVPSPTPYPEFTFIPKSVMTPAWETPPAGTRPEVQAREALISFLYLLSEKQYLKAAAYYGGGMEGFEFTRQEHPDFFDRVAALKGQTEQFWRLWCSGLLACFPVGNIASTDIISKTEFVFWVQLVYVDPVYYYASNSCCAANPAIKAPVSQFGFTVRLVDGKYMVMNPPPILE